MTRRAVPWRGLLAAATIAAALALLAYFLRRDWGAVQAVRWGAHPGLLVLHFALLGLMFAFFVAGWRGTLTACGAPCSWSDAAFAWLTPNLGKYLPGKVLMLAGRVEVCRVRGLSRRTAAVALVYEHVLMVLAAVPFLLGALAAGTGGGEASRVVALGAAAAAALALLAWPGMLTRALNAVLTRLGRECLTTTPRRGALLALFPTYVLAWGAYGLSGAVLVRALELGDASLTTGFTSCAFVASWLAGFLSFLTPGGIGVREGVLAAFLATTLTASQGVVLAAVARLTWTIVELGGAALGTAVFTRRRSGDSSLQR